MNYIFLDIDGVMNNKQDWINKVKNNLEQFHNHRMFCDDAWALLSNVCKITNAKIILSSTWRIGFKQTEDGLHVINSDDTLSTKLIEYFKKYNIEVVGRTSALGFYRGTQILEYVKKFLKHSDSWIVVDDEDCNLNCIPKDKVIRTSFETGLTKEHCDKIIKYFTPMVER